MFAPNAAPQPHQGARQRLICCSTAKGASRSVPKWCQVDRQVQDSRRYPERPRMPEKIQRRDRFAGRHAGRDQHRPGGRAV